MVMIMELPRGTWQTNSNVLLSNRSSCSSELDRYINNRIDRYRTRTARMVLTTRSCVSYLKSAVFLLSFIFPLLSPTESASATAHGGDFTIYAFPVQSATWKANVKDGQTQSCNWGNRSCWPVDDSDYSGDVATGAINPNTVNKFSAGAIKQCDKLPFIISDKLDNVKEVTSDLNKMSLSSISALIGGAVSLPLTAVGDTIGFVGGVSELLPKDGVVTVPASLLDPGSYVAYAYAGSAIDLYKSDDPKKRFVASTPVGC